MTAYNSPSSPGARRDGDASGQKVYLPADAPRDDIEWWRVGIALNLGVPIYSGFDETGVYLEVPDGIWAEVIDINFNFPGDMT